MYIGGPAWGTEVNEPGGQLFGEAPLKAGERRKIQSWEVIFYSTMLASTLILGIGLNNKPESKTIKHIEAEAQRRVALMNLDDENDK